MNELEQKFLEHSAKGTQWERHAYLYITPSGRYVYPEDIAKGGTKYGSKEYEQQNAKRGQTINTRSSFSRPTASKSTTKTTTSSSVAKTNQAAASIANKSSNSKYTSNLSDEQKKILGQDDESKKKEEEKKKKAEEKAKKEAEKAAKKTASTTKKTTASKEAQDLNLTEDDIKLLSSNIDTNATNREDVINGVALKVIRGDFGNGKERQEKLGRFYGVIQARVNELMKTMRGKNQAKKNTSKKVTKTTKNTAKKSVKYGSDEYYKQTGKSGTTVNNRKTVKHSDEDEFLIHWGIKRRSGRYAYGTGDRPYQHDPNAKRKYKEKTSLRKTRTMPDAELEDRIARLKKEAELQRLEKDAINNAKTKGEKFIEAVMSDAGKKALTVATTGALLYLGSSFISGEFSRHDFGQAVFKGGSGKNK